MSLDRYELKRDPGIVPGVLIKKEATNNHFTHLISGQHVVRCFEDGELKIIYVPMMPAESLLRACQNIRYQENHRTAGMVSVSRVFANMPRRPLRGDFCHVSKLASESPAEHKVLLDWARRATAEYARHSPEKFAEQHTTLLENVRPEWIIPQSVFTGGIVNKANPLPFHRDAGNFSGVWSMMYALQEGCSGGLLVMPEYHLAFEFSGTVLIGFDGQAIVHGVTAITKARPGGFRFSVVYYALKAMRHCLGYNDELARIKSVKTSRETKRLKVVDADPE